MKKTKEGRPVCKCGRGAGSELDGLCSACRARAHPEWRRHKGKRLTARGEWVRG